MRGTWGIPRRDPGSDVHGTESQTKGGSRVAGGTGVAAGRKEPKVDPGSGVKGKPGSRTQCLRPPGHTHTAPLTPDPGRAHRFVSVAGTAALPHSPCCSPTHPPGFTPPTYTKSHRSVLILSPFSPALESEQDPKPRYSPLLPNYLPTHIPRPPCPAPLTSRYPSTAPVPPLPPPTKHTSHLTHNPVPHPDTPPTLPPPSQICVRPQPQRRPRPVHTSHLTPHPQPPAHPTHTPHKSVSVRSPSTTPSPPPTPPTPLTSLYPSAAPAPPPPPPPSSVSPLYPSHRT